MVDPRACDMELHLGREDVGTLVDELREQADGQLVRASGR